MKPGEVWSVSGGYGLMLVVGVATAGPAGTVQSVRMRGHGPQRDSADHWFPAERLVSRATDDTIRREYTEARARDVACQTSNCWCQVRRSTPPKEAP